MESTVVGVKIRRFSSTSVALVILWNGCHLRHRDSSILVVGALSEPYRNPLCDGFTLIDFQGGGLRDIGSELGAESCHVVGEERGLVAGAGDGDVAEPGVE